MTDYAIDRDKAENDEIIAIPIPSQGLVLLVDTEGAATTLTFSHGPMTALSVTLTRDERRALHGALGRGL